MLKSKLKTNQIRIIAGDNCLQLSVIFSVYSCTFPSTFHKKLSTNISLTVTSNINEVIATISSLYIFFYEEILHAQKSIKTIKNTKSTKRQTSDFLPLRCFLCA